MDKLESAILQGKGKRELKKVLVFLTEYTEEHFGYEEGYMDAWEYDDAEKHRWEHDVFRENIRRIAAEVDASGPSAAAATEVRRLSAWACGSAASSPGKPRAAEVRRIAPR